MASDVSHTAVRRAPLNLVQTWRSHEAPKDRCDARRWYGNGSQHRSRLRWRRRCRVEHAQAHTAEDPDGAEAQDGQAVVAQAEREQDAASPPIRDPAPAPDAEAPPGALEAAVTIPHSPDPGEAPIRHSRMGALPRLRVLRRRVCDRRSRSCRAGRRRVRRGRCGVRRRRFTRRRAGWRFGRRTRRRARVGGRSVTAWGRR